MDLLKERTRLLITGYTDGEKRHLEDMVASMDNVYMYQDPDSGVLGLEPGITNSIKRIFPYAKFRDNSSSYWDFNKIQPVEHNAAPRNQLQKDFIQFVLDNAKKKQKLAGILGCGSGKTFMACYSAIALGLKTLFIAPTSSIKQQWVDTLVKMFNVQENRVCNVRGPRDFINVAPNSDFVVVSHASLASLNKNYDLEKIMRRNKFGIKVIDEVQMWFKNIITIDANCNIPNNWYLTGTFGRSGETENKIYQEMFGDLAIFREKEKTPTVFNRRPGNIYGQKPYHHVTMVWMKSGLSKEEIKKVTNSMRYSEREGKWVRFGISVPAYMDLIIPPDGTLTPYMKTLFRVIWNAEMQVKYGKMLILGTTINGSEIIAEYVRKMFPNKKVGTYHSRNTREQNTRNKAECDIMVSTTQSAGTGFDWKGLSKVILYAPMKSWILCQQVIFRNRRRDDGKDCYHWDVVDSQIPQLRAWANVRADVYKRVGKSFKVIDM